MTHETKDLYQEIYDNADWYGNANEGRCPGVRLFPHYEKWLDGSVIDFGCGRGHNVQFLRKKGYTCDGIDQIDLGNNMIVGNVTQHVKFDKEYTTCICMDVIEHIDPEIIAGLFENFKQVDRQIFSIHNGPSIYEGKELHVNRKSWEDWDKEISELFDIQEKVKIHNEQYLYYTQKKK